MARNLDEDLHSVLHQAASSCEAATRLSADKDNEEEEDESNVGRLEGPETMGYSPPWPPGPRLRHIHRMREYVT